MSSISFDDGVAGQEDSLAMIVGMGYTQEQAKEALDNNGGNVDDAIDDLFLGRSRKKKMKRMNESVPAVETAAPTAAASSKVKSAAPTKSFSYEQQDSSEIPYDEEATLLIHNRPSVRKSKPSPVSAKSKSTVAKSLSPESAVPAIAPDEEAPQPSTDANKSAPSFIKNWWSRSSKRKKQLVVLGALVTLLIVVLAIAIPVSKNNNSAPSDDEPASSPGPGPTPQDQPTESSPSTSQEKITELISSMSADGGAALNTTNSPQNQALNWIVGNANLASYSDSKVIQRYALATLYYSTNGNLWKDRWGWLSDDDECSPEGWFQSKGALEESFCNEEGKLVQLKLMFNRMNGMIPEEIRLLADSLEILDLASNNLQGPIPSTIGDLTQLRTLILSGNQLNGAIPASIGQLASLERLWLYGNLLYGTIPEEIGMLTNLVQLSFVWNKLSGGIPKSIGKMTNLVEFWLYHNSLSGPLPSSIGQMTKLERLWLYGNQLSDVIPATVFQMTSLVDLRLQDNNLGGEIPNEISSMTNLKDLRLQGNNLGGEIPNEIRSMTNLKSLWLYDNGFSGDFECPDFIYICYISCDYPDDDFCREL